MPRNNRRRYPVSGCSSACHHAGSGANWIRVGPRRAGAAPLLFPAAVPSV